MNDKEMMSHEEYREDWLKKHPASIPTEEIEDSPYPVWARILVFAGFITSALVSGVHTMTVVYNSVSLSPMVDEMLRQWTARGAFVTYELGLFLAAFLMVVQATKRLAQLISTIIFATLIAVNLYSVLQVYGFDLEHDIAGAMVTAMFSLVPVIAYGCGKLYVNIGAAERALKRKAKERLRDDNIKLDAAINQGYSKYVKDFEKTVHKANSLNSLNERPQAQNYSLNSANGYTKQMNSREIISEFFKQHPEFRNMTLDQLNDAIAEETGIRVGRTSIHNVRKEWLGVAANGNGNGHGSN